MIFCGGIMLGEEEEKMRSVLNDARCDATGVEWTAER